MPKRVTTTWLSGVARGLTAGGLALSVLSTGGVLPTASAPRAFAEEIDCYNDKDLYNLPECIEQRAVDDKQGMGRREAQGAGPDAQQAGQSGGDTGQQSGGQPSGGNPQQQAGSPPQQTNNPPQQATNPPSQSSPPQQQAANPPAQNDSEGEQAERPRGPITDPWQVVLTVADAGKEATQYISEEGNDKYGRWARTRFERDRSTGASTLGPNVMDSKVWIAKDANAAKELFKEQAAIKNFPERKEGINGPVEKVKPTSYGQEFSFIGGYFQDEKVWQHYRFVILQGNVVSVLYLFGREEFFLDPKDKGWTGQGDWFTAALFHRM